jgi:hypothetical protein
MNLSERLARAAAERSELTPAPGGPVVNLDAHVDSHPSNYLLRLSRREIELLAHMPLPDDDEPEAAEAIVLDDVVDIDAHELALLEDCETDPGCVKGSHELLDAWTEEVRIRALERDDRLARMRSIIEREKSRRHGPRPIDLRDESARNSVNVREARHIKQGFLRTPSPERDMRQRVERKFSCPSCGRDAQIDLCDTARGRVHLSCGPCLATWQQDAERVPD